MAGTLVLISTAFERLVLWMTMSSLVTATWTLAGQSTFWMWLCDVWFKKTMAMLLAGMPVVGIGTYVMELPGAHGVYE